MKRVRLLEFHDYEPNLTAWRDFASIVDTATETVIIALVGKHIKLTDSYLSVNKALKYVCIHQGLKLELKFIESSHLQEDNKKREE